MYQFEDLFIKISNDFHAEINPILEQINSEAKQSFWFDRKSISGKLFIVRDLLLSLNASEQKQYLLTRLKRLLEIYKERLITYFDTHDIATCFVYNSLPEDFTKTQEYFISLEDYSITSNLSVGFGYRFMEGMEIIGFPNDCSYKFAARLRNSQIEIEEQSDPFPWNFEKGKQIGSPLRTRQQQREIEVQLYNKDHKRLLKQDFTEFAKTTQLKIFELIRDFDLWIKLCNSIIEKKQIDSTPANLPEIEKIHEVLKNGYLQEAFERFLLIFNPDYKFEKLIWLKTGTELKYFIDRINDKFHLSNEINKWTEQRFQFIKPVKSMAAYLSKQTSKDEYQLLIQGNLRKNPLYKLFRE